MSITLPLLLRVAFRNLRRHPGFSAIALLTIALGIGANTAVFSVVNAVLLRPLPYRDPAALVVALETNRDDEISVAYLDLLDWRTQAETLDDIAAFAGRAVNLTGGGDPERLRTQIVTANLFSVLGVTPLLGRGFAVEEDRRGGSPVVVLGYGLWQQRYGGNPGIVGTSITLDGTPFEVIGVMPKAFDFPGGLVYGAADAYLPVAVAPASWDDRDEHPGIVAVARLAPGATLGAAQVELATIASRLETSYPTTNRQVGVRVRGAIDQMVGDYRSALLLLLGSALLVLVIATVNVIHLVLVRAVGRQRELAIRSALGARKQQLIVQLLSESLILAGLGGMLGIALAALLTTLAGSLISDLPRQGVTVIDPLVLLFALAVIVISGVASGFAPILWARVEARSIALRSRESAPHTQRVRHAFVIAETGLACLLLVAAGVLVRSFSRLTAETGGIRSEGVLSWEINLPGARYGEGLPILQFFAQILERISSLPGVEAAGAISVLPFSGSGNQSGIAPLPHGDMRREVRTDVHAVTPGYFETMGIRLIKGRAFQETDGPSAPVVGIVDETLAERFFPGADPIGQRLQGWGFAEITIVGVVNHVKSYGVAAESRQQLYINHAQRPYTRMVSLARTRGDPADLAGPVRQIIAELDPDLPLANVRTVRDVVEGTQTRPKLAASLSGGFALLALGLAVIGLYGVLAHSVLQRRREFGIRMALGASPEGIRIQILSSAVRLVGAGLLLGTLAAAAGARLLRGLTYGIDPLHPATFVLAPVVFLSVAVAAALIPARRAARIPLTETLQEE